MTFMQWWAANCDRFSAKWESAKAVWEEAPNLEVAQPLPMRPMERGWYFVDVAKNENGETVITTTTAPFDDELEMQAFVDALPLAHSDFDAAKPEISIRDFAVKAIKAWVKR